VRDGEMVPVRCPYCGEMLELHLEADLLGSLVQDCEVCCNPIALEIRRDAWGDPEVRVDRAD
jgi:hypothetical protein